jgi:outer membrane protein
MLRLITAIMLAGWGALAQPAEVSVRVTGAPAEGVLVFQVYDSPNAFGDFRDPVKELRATNRTDDVYRLNDVPAGASWYLEQLSTERTARFRAREVCCRRR